MGVLSCFFFERAMPRGDFSFPSCWLVICVLLLSFDLCRSQVVSNVYPEGKLISPHCYLPGNRSTCAPSFIVIGSMKSGTTSLYSYLINHPQVNEIPSTARLNNRAILADKEVRFFLPNVYDPSVKKNGIKAAVNEYLDVFSPIKPPTSSDDVFITGEASPMYVCPMGVAPTIKKVLPHVTLIWMMRNPIDRAYSDFWFKEFLQKQVITQGSIDRMLSHFSTCSNAEIARLRECKIAEIAQSISLQKIKELGHCMNDMQTKAKNNCKQGVEAANPICIPQAAQRFCQANQIRNGLYIFQVVEWLREFPKNQLYFINSDEFYRDEPKVMAQLTKKLQLEEFDWSRVTTSAYNIVNPGTLSASDLAVDAKHAGLAIGKGSNTQTYPPMPREIRLKLQEFYAPYNKALFDLLGLDPFW